MNEPKNGIPTLKFVVLDGEHAQAVDPHSVKWPASSLVTYAYRGDQIVGRCALIEVPHIEGTWVAPAEQKSTVAFRMVDSAEKTLKHVGKTHVIVFVESDNAAVQQYAARMGYKLQPLQVWVKEI